MIYLCSNGHMHRDQINTINCHVCRRNNKRRETMRQRSAAKRKRGAP